MTTKTTIRRARPGDVGAMMSLKQALRLEPGQSPSRGGFLLGCSAERYAQFVAAANVLVLELRGEMAGFAITLPDGVLRASDLWSRRDLIHWYAGEGEPPQSDRLAYFEQLALAPHASRIHGPALAWAALREVARAGHDHLYATLLDQPVRNDASLPLLRAIGARPVATVAEEYEGIGAVVSELYHLRLDAAFLQLSSTSLGQRLTASARRAA